MSEMSESIIRGLNEMLDHTQGKIELKSRYVSATPPTRDFTSDEIRTICAEHTKK